MTAMVAVTIRHLEMASRKAFRPVDRSMPAMRLRREAGDDAGELARQCYAIVGGPWHWTDRADLDAEAWTEWLAEEQGELWVARDGTEIAGYFLLIPHGHTVEIRFFGLAPDHIGRGIGGWLLTRAVERAWSLDPHRVTLNTCSLDGPAALPNYLARGFTVVREEHRMRELA